ncbi:Pentatricopeptide repeat [Macleaya cordata]|uniref:Pentatricopeptide repeat n=1 Tax=Macleaya cordata TaxID=56857 RepID=A0A200QEZ3_MACCD|nr:Pentatricopeptide repeat [Macleaya cordata]
MKGAITKLVSNGLYREALSLFTRLHSNHFPPNNLTYPSLLKACGKLNLASNGLQIHAHVVKTGFYRDVYTATALTDMYMKLHLLKDGVKMFDEMPERNLASINAVISGLSQNGYFREALLVFKHVGIGGFKPNSITLASVLPACETVKDGFQIHGFAVKLGVEVDIYVATSVLSMYLNCQELVSAVRVFKMIEDKSVVSYNALISGLLHNGLPLLVLDLFKEMRESLGEKPSLVTWVSVLSACSGLLTLRFGKQVHCLILKYEVGFDVKVGTAFVDMYSKCGCWKEAYEIFKELDDNRNLITWNSMISGMMLNGQCELAAELFEQLEQEGMEPDSASWNSMISGFSQLGKGIEAFCFFNRMQLAGVMPSLKSVTSLLPACSVLSALQSGKEIHGHTIRTAIDADEFISTSVIDMYMKCGVSFLARRVFDRVDRSDDPALWNAMILGYGRNGENDYALEIFDLMLKEGIKPNSGTFISILSACGHAGKVEKGLELFRMMSRDYGVNPTPEHFGCMVDLLGRDGRLDEARNLIQEISEPSSSVYASLLGACKCHLDAELGEEMVERLSQLEPGDPSPFVILSNIYAGQGRWKDVQRVREMMKDRGLRKLPGCSW